MATEKINGNDLYRMLASGLVILSERYKEVDLLNVFPVPDGDTGTNMLHTLTAAVDEVSVNNRTSVSKAAEAASRGALMGARGNSGVILSQLLRGFALSIKDKDTITAKEFSTALAEGVNIAVKAVMKPVEGTILTVARDAAKIAIQEANKNLTLEQVLEETCKTAEATLKRTPDLLPALKEAGVVDAGGMGWFIILQGFNKALSVDTSFDKNLPDSEQFFTRVDQAGRNESPIFENPYCTEILLKPLSAVDDRLTEELSGYGDSLLIAESDGLVKIHIHTALPQEVVGLCLNYGALSKVKIENMNEQAAQNVSEKKRKPFGIISVASGEGITGVMKSLGVDTVISGGQSMNPSISQLLQGVEDLNTDTVIILPNNSNIILSANQIPEMTVKTVHVIPTRTIPEALAALLAVSPQMEAGQAANAMVSAAGNVRTGEVTYAVRDTTINGIEINKGNAIGLFKDEVLSGNTINETVTDLLKKMIIPGSELCTVYFGEMIDKNDAEKLSAELSEHFPEIDIEIIDGGQPVYYYIISVE